MLCIALRRKGKVCGFTQPASFSTVSNCELFELHIAFLISLLGEDEVRITSALLIISNTCFEVFFGGVQIMCFL